MPSRTKRLGAFLRHAALAALALGGVAAALATASGCKAQADQPQAQTAGAKESKETLASLTPDEVSDGIAKKTLFIFDNNSKKVYADGHVPSAKWVDYKALKASDLPQDKSARLVFYCANES